MSDPFESENRFVMPDKSVIHPDNTLELPPAMMDMSALEDILGPDAYKMTPATLANRVSLGDWIPAKHLLHLSALIANKLAQGGARIIISLPPRHGKSELISHWTSVWALTHYPWWEIILASYGADLATDFGRKVRDTINYDMNPTEGEGLTGIGMNKNVQNAGRWMTSQKGGMRSVGVGGTMYGRGAHLLLIDDYFKNPEEAMSEAHREKVFEWFSTIAMSRLAPGGSAIIIATRWHKDDLSGKLKDLPNSLWEEICIPVFAYDDPDEPDPLGRKPGEVLWPERYGEDAINELKSTMTSYFFSAIMQQKPLPSQSQHFRREWINIIPEEALPHKDYLKIIRSWDLAGTEDDGDWTVGTKMARDTRTNKLYILERERFRKAPGGVKSHIRSTMEMDGIEVKVIIEQEPGSAGKAVIDGYVSDNPEFAVSGNRSTGDKIVRAEPFFAACEHSRVYMVKHDTWNDEMLDEIVASPEGKYDDQLDTLSQGYNNLYSYKPKAGAFGREGIARENEANISAGSVVTGVVFGR